MSFQNQHSKLFNSCAPTWYGTIELTEGSKVDNANVVRIHPNGQRTIIFEDKDIEEYTPFIIGLSSGVLSAPNLPG